MWIEKVWNRFRQSVTRRQWGSGGDGTQIESSDLKIESSWKFQGTTINSLSGHTEIRNKRITGVNFDGAQLRSLRLFDVTFIGCSFNGANLKDLRMWSTEMRECSFRDADLREAGLGGLLEGRRNSFIDVDFSGADMRRTGWTSADLKRCLFRDTRMEGINFQGSTFSHCTFAGEVRDVIFNRYAFRKEDLPANQMDHIDFTNAQLHFVDFRNLKLDQVKFPNDAQHLVFTNYRHVLERAIGRLQEADDPVAHKLVFFLSNIVKWTVEDQAQGILNRSDLVKLAGETTPQRLLEAIS